jgi:hypothetical protein
LSLSRSSLDIPGQPDGTTICNCTVYRRYGALWAYDYDADSREAAHIGSRADSARARPNDLLQIADAATMRSWSPLSKRDEEGPLAG